MSSAQQSKTHAKALAPPLRSPGACSRSPRLPGECQVLGLGTGFTKRPWEGGERLG